MDPSDPVSPGNQCKGGWLQQEHPWAQPAAHSKVKLYYIYTALVHRHTRTCLVIHDTPQPENSHLAHTEEGSITLSSISLNVCWFLLHLHLLGLGPGSYLYLRLLLS